MTPWSVRYTTRAAEAASLPAEAMRMEVQRAAKRPSPPRPARQQDRQDLNPIPPSSPRRPRHPLSESSAAPWRRRGVIRLLVQDDTLFSAQPPLRPEEFSSPLLGRIYSELWQGAAAVDGRRCPPC